MTIPWQLELGRVDAHQLAIEHLGRELVPRSMPSLAAPLGAQAAGAPSAQVHARRAGADAARDRAARRPARAAAMAHRGALAAPALAEGAPRRSLAAPVHGPAPLLARGAVRRVPAARRARRAHAPPRSSGPRARRPTSRLGDAVLPWQAIRWRLGHAGGWQLGALARPTCPGELELIARRAEPGIPPALALTATSGARAISIERHEPWSTTPAPLHVARYRFPPAWLGARAYVQVTARNGAGSAGAGTFELQLPTSLTDRSHRQLGRAVAGR